MRLNEFILLEKNLSVYQLSALPRYDSRVDVLIKKITSGEPFVTSEKKQVVLEPIPELIEVLARRDWDTFKKQWKQSFPTQGGGSIRLTQLFKTAEFGGEEARKRLAKEDFAIEQLNKKLNEIKKETGSDTVDIVVGNDFYPVIKAAKSTPGTPKSDFHLLNIKNTPVIFISHKDGLKPTRIQQWSGITEPGIVDHLEVKEFVNSVREELANNGLEDFPKGQSWAKQIQDERLKMMAVYGRDFGGSVGINNVTVVIQGKLDLLPLEQGYELTGDNIEYNGQRISGGYEPAFMVRYSSDRRNFGIKFARMSISPIANRKITKYL